MSIDEADWNLGRYDPIWIERNRAAVEQKREQRQKQLALMQQYHGHLQEQVPKPEPTFGIRVICRKCEALVWQGTTTGNAAPPWPAVVRHMKRHVAEDGSTALDLTVEGMAEW